MRGLHPLLMLLVIMTVSAGCSVSRFIPEDEYLLNNVKIHSSDKSVSTTRATCSSIPIRDGSAC